jgi:hypothetical protein
MNKHRPSTCCYHSSSLPSPVPDTPVATVCSEHSHRQTCDHHSITDNDLHRNNHNSDLMQYDQVSKSLNEIPIRKRRKGYYHRSEKKCSLVPIYVNKILLILIRLMLLFITVLMISFTFYYAIVYIYPKPKKTGWEKIVDWLYQE